MAKCSALLPSFLTAAAAFKPAAHSAPYRLALALVHAYNPNKLNSQNEISNDIRCTQLHVPNQEDTNNLIVLQTEV